MTARAGAVLSLALACLGCPRKGPDLEEELTRVEYVRRNFRGALAGCTDPFSGTPGACVQLDVDYVEPSRASVSLAAAIAGFLEETVLRPVEGAAPAESIEALRDELYERYRRQQAEVPGYQTPWRIRRSVAVGCNTKRVQGLVAVDRSAAGDEQPAEQVEFRTFDTKTGAPLGLDAMVAPDLLDRFTEVIRERVEQGGGGIGADGADGAAEGAQGSIFDRSPQRSRSQGFVDPDGVLLCPETIGVQWRDNAGRTAVQLPRREVKSFVRGDAP